MASWNDEPRGKHGISFTDPDERGGIHSNFELPGRVFDSEIRLWAGSGDRSIDVPIDVPPLNDAPITLRIAPVQAISLEGRVVDRASLPVPGASVEIWSEWKTPFGFVVQTPVVFDGAVELVADADGQTLSLLASTGHYRAVARTDGFAPNYTAWVRPDVAKDGRFPDLPLSRLRSVTGRVVDRQARPVVGARVFQLGNGVKRTETATDELGRFTLAGVPDEVAFVFAEKVAFRFHGQPIPAGANETEMVIDRADEPVEELVSPPTDVSSDERIALARRVLAPYVEPAFASTNEDERYEMLGYLIDIDPTAALERIDAQSLPHVDADTFDFLRGRIAKGLYRENTDEALAVVESIHDPDRRFRAYIDLAGLTEPSQHLRKRELLDQAQLLMVSTNQANLRAIWIYCVADGLLDLGETERAKTLLDEARSIAAALPRAGNGGDARGYVAQALARIDLPSALELVRDLEGDKALDAVHGKIALRIAKAQPAESQRVLDMVRDEFRRGSWAIRVCYRMADADPERARQIAGQIVNPNLRAYALGLMAKAWSSSDKRRALGWFDEAFELLADVVEAGEERIGGPQPAAGVAAALLSVAELIDARLLRERLWRTISFQRGLWSPQHSDADRSRCELALLMAQYDRNVARHLLEPLVVGVRASGLNAMTAGDDDAFFSAAVAIDPNWAVELFEGIAAGAADSDGRLNSVRGRLAWTLARPPERIIRDHVEMWFNHWVPDMLDNEFYVDY